MVLQLFTFACALVLLMKGYDCGKCATYWQTVKTDKDSCVDKNKSCATWSIQGECIKSKDFMMSNCCTACSPCRDERDFCDELTRIPGQCDLDFFKLNCPTSCGICTMTTERKVQKCEASVKKCEPKASLRNSYISASSQLQNFEVNLARIGGGHGWCARVDDTKPFVHLDLRSIKEISGLNIQGAHAEPASFVKTFFLSFSETTETWYFYPENTNPPKAKLFHGNSDRKTIVKYDLVPFKARYIRVYPQTWQNYACVRMEIYSC
ncbi:neuropilin-2-like [Hydractinia symbiolongicarpus]|uniref:neuropilin-2-like n=1 Tax=Hydractinia symbiolongicarpus TaxID=13093 RepID=UPI0025515CEC|nr:neuropilin-2-like [Hydractinia symbiolongicarpus]